APGRPGAPGAGSQTTAEDGLFRFDDVPPQSYLLVVTSLGYHRFEDSLQVQPGREIRLVVHLSASPLELEPLMVVTARRPAFMDGFEERRSHARLHTAFFTHDEIQELDPRDVTELLRTVPGTFVAPGLFGDRLMVDGDVTRGGHCRPDVWVNGLLMIGGPSYNDVYPPDDIAAVELYAIEHDVPQRFKGPRRCGALVIWLRERGPDEQFPAAWKRWLAALGFLGAAILLAR
ncbi:MAG TPA: carboxypeptidase regulatory-like domain-containing protein, partial [Longimicrobiales bacterium]|nr:carboxypeptidase regulatory-like domain-containing protein [Longimicrobiales bacterium]